LARSAEINEITLKTAIHMAEVLILLRKRKRKENPTNWGPPGVDALCSPWFIPTETSMNRSLGINKQTASFPDSFVKLRCTPERLILLHQHHSAERLLQRATHNIDAIHTCKVPYRLQTPHKSPFYMSKITHERMRGICMRQMHSTMIDMDIGRGFLPLGKARAYGQSAMVPCVCCRQA
jgi:hypothetical protein